MKLNLRFRHCPDTEASRKLITEGLESLRGDLQITAAHAIVEQPSEGSPAIRAAVHLEVPGPDITASASDYTLAAAWRKVMKSLKRQTQRRLERREARSLSSPLRRPGMAAASRA
jgi:ribosome-associated translation inhibitor RaiA